MAINSDFRDLFFELNRSGARYLLVGAHAVALYAQPRFTKDLDVWVEPTAANAAHVFEALQRFGAPLADVAVTDLAQPDLVFQIGVDPNRIDVMTGIDGVDFSEAWEAHAVTVYGDEEVPVISKAHLIRNKRTSARPQDLIDLEALA